VAVTGVRVGDVLHLREADYRYGAGPLVLRVTAVADQQCDPEWVTLRGVEIRWTGAPGDERTTQVRRTALRDPRTRRAGPAAPS
jgi:hypothetical protein